MNTYTNILIISSILIVGGVIAYKHFQEIEKDVKKKWY